MARAVYLCAECNDEFSGICQQCHCCDDCCECDDGDELFDADELGLDPEDDAVRKYVSEAIIRRAERGD